MIELDKSYIKLGDSKELILKIPDKSVDCIYTDVPYDYGITKVKEFKETDDLATRAMKTTMNELADLNIANGFDYKYFIRQFERILKRCNIFIWCSKSQINDITNYVLEVFGKVNYEILVWTKSNPTPATNNTWLPDVEYCLYFRAKGVRLNDGYHIKSKFYASSTNQKDKKKFKHPTIKPLKMVKNHLLHATKEGDIVVDPFAGSFTTAVASKDVGRNYIAFEISRKYYDMGDNRLKRVDANGRQSMFYM